MKAKNRKNPTDSLLGAEEQAEAAERAKDPRVACKSIEALFGLAQRRLLALLFGQPDRSFHVNELMRRAVCGSRSVQRELARLLDAGLLDAECRAGRTLYRANAEALVYPELCGMFRKTLGLAAPLREALAPLQGCIEGAFLCEAAYGAWPGPLALELVVLADDWLDGLELAVAGAERRLGRRVELLVVEAQAMQDGGYFHGSILQRPRVWVLGDERLLGRGCAAPMTSGP